MMSMSLNWAKPSREQIAWKFHLLILGDEPASRFDIFRVQGFRNRRVGKKRLSTAGCNQNIKNNGLFLELHPAAVTFALPKIKGSECLLFNS